MIDLHCHILPGLDDGPQSVEESVRMLRVAAADGISTLVATPHIQDYPAHETTLAGLRVKADLRLFELQRWCGDQNLSLRLVLGAELDARLSSARAREFAINGGRYVLIEFPHGFLPTDAARTVFNLLVAGLVPIIAHPERNASVIENPKKLVDLTQAGALVQITGGSLLGDFGVNAQACAQYLLKIGVVSFLASDAHSPLGRPPVLSKAVDVAARWVGQRIARDLVTANPAAVVANRPLPGLVGWTSEQSDGPC